MTGIAYPEIAAERSMGSSDSPEYSTPPPAFSESINLLMTAAGALLALVGFFAFGIWLCGRCTQSQAAQAGTGAPQQVAMKALGLSKEAIARIPVETGASNESCAICLGEFNAGDDKARVLPKCSHQFHVECIDMWLFSHKTCPTCRCDLSSLEQMEVTTPTDVVVVVVHSG